MEVRTNEPAILLTGFEAFGDSEKNPTAEIVRLLDGTSVGDHRVSGIALPVTAAGAPKALKEAIALHDPSLVLSLGLAGGRNMLALERVAINVLDFPIPDNDGLQPSDEPVVEDGPAAYLTTLPIKAILAAWQEAGLPGYVSNTAVTYVCNQTFYNSLHRSGEHGYRAGLIHVPYLPEQAAGIEGGASSMSLDLMVEAVEIALRVSTERSKDLTLPAGAIS
jgi:pyroglutamyl-peptidase